MSRFVQKMRDFAAKTSAEKGDFWLFALLMPEERPFSWDVVVSAPWLKGRGRQSVDRVTAGITEVLDSDELFELSKVVVLGPDNPIVERLSRLEVPALGSAGPTLKAVDLGNRQQADVLLIAAHPTSEVGAYPSLQ
jgi:hypothetical protein